MNRTQWKISVCFFATLVSLVGATPASAARGSIQSEAPPNAVEEKGIDAGAKLDGDDAKPDDESPAVSATRRPTFDRQSDEILESLKPITIDANRVTVQISTQGRPISLGVIVDSSGFVLTKASELKGALMCKLADGRSVSANVFGVHQKTDLALLKIEATQLPIADWSTAETPAVGYWIVTPRLDDPPSLGIVSVKPRTISPPIGYIGVELKPHADGVRIDKILAKSPAEKAGLQINDVIVEVNGQSITDRAMLIEAIQKNSVGAEVTLKVLRLGQPLEFQLQLTDHTVFGQGADRSEVQNEMGGRLSKRRLDFPMALQHDTPLSPSECGGPIIDLTGKIVGINIARAGRVDSLALPVSTVLSVMEILKSGELRPTLIYKTEIEKIQSRLQEISAEMLPLPQRKSELTELLDRDKRELESLKRDMEEAQARLQAVEAQHAQTAHQLNAANAGASKLQKEKERLESDLQKLMSGTN